GLHCHTGSHVFRLDAITRAVEKMVGLVRAIEEHTGNSVEELNLGGGLGVRYVAEDEPPSIAEYSRLVHDAVAKALADAGVRSQPLLMTEPGRSIAAPAGLTLYTVGTIKHIEGVRTYVAVDGGMSDNLRPVTYGARYEAFLPARARAERPLVTTIAGKHCEQGDIVVRDAHLPGDLVVGDVLATPVTGAYGYSMASNYNKVARPPVVFVRDGEARVVVRRESEEDLVSRDTDGKRPSPTSLLLLFPCASRRGGGAMSSPAEVRLAQVAALQHGVFGRAQVLDAGLTKSQLDRRLQDRRWIRVLPRVYRDAAI